MRKFTLFFTILFYASYSQAQTFIPEQFASTVIGFSSQLNTTNFSANQISGTPDRYPNCGGDRAWSPSVMDGGAEYIEVGYATPQPVNTIRIYQTNGAGSVTSVLLREAGTSTWNTVYTAVSAANGCAKILEIQIPTTSYNADALRINVDNNIPDWQYFDAVSIGNFTMMTYQWEQYAGSVIDKSSEYSTGSWAAVQATGPPDTWPSCGDIGTAWASSNADFQREFLVLGFSYPAKANRVRIYQTLAPGAIDTVYLREAGTTTWHQIYSATAAPAAVCPQLLEINFTTTTYLVDAIRIALNSPVVPNWNEIDAVALQSELPSGAKLSVKTGNWSDPTTWSGGTIPAPADTIILGNGHVITLDINASIKSGIIGTGATLVVPASNSLILGPGGGGKEFLQVYGKLNITGGSLTVNGNIEFSSGSQFDMTSGLITEDGNDGTSGGSVANGLPLFILRPGMSLVSFTGGMLTIVDPQYNATGQAVVGNYIFGIGSTLKIGNGVSTQASNNTFGFGGSNPHPQLGNMIVDAVTATGNRQYRINETVVVAGDLTVTSGTLNPIYIFTVKGNVVNNGTIANASTFRTLGDLTNNGAVTMNGGSISVGNNFTNNIGATYNVITGSYTSVGRNLVNDGSFTSNWLYMANNFNVSSNPQTLGGSGTFSVYGLDPINNNVAGVTLLIPLTIQFLYFEISPGKLFIGNNDLNIVQYAYGSPGSDRYVVINGTGKLINKNIGSTPEIFPVGTSASYTPLTIENGSGHDFAVSVRSTFTSPPTSAPVNREWNITDLTGGAVAATMTFQWNATDEDAAFTRNLCFAAHYTTQWDAISPGAPASGTDPYTRKVTNISTFSPFGIFSGGVVLPVHLISFTASKQANLVRLTWKVAGEKDMASYEIERNSGGNGFTKILSVNPVNQMNEHTYQMNDPSPATGISYYRLKQVEASGRNSYSSVAKIDFSHKYNVFISPNPVKDEIRVQGLGNFDAVALIDMNGRIVKQWKLTNGDPLDVREINAGLYHLRLVAKDEVQTHQLMISR